MDFSTSAWVRISSSRIPGQSPFSLYSKRLLLRLVKPVSHPERARLSDERAADVLNVLGALGDGQHESIGDQAPKCSEV